MLPGLHHRKMQSIQKTHEFECEYNEDRPPNDPVRGEPCIESNI